MCQFIDVMEKLKSASSNSVANEEFSPFNNYMHMPSEMDERLSEMVSKAANYRKALVLVCGNSGDGKSHLIAKLKEQGIISADKFSVYIDATSSDKKGMKANEKLREKFMPLSDENIIADKEFRIIVAINLGILNDFLKKYEREFSIIKRYVDEQGLFDNIPTWKLKKMQKEEKRNEGYFIGHIDFTSFHRYEITNHGLDLSFINGLLGKLVVGNKTNKMREIFDKGCELCPKRANCPVYWNYKTLSSDGDFRAYVIEVLAKAAIKNNITPSVREINNFFYEIIIGTTFDEKLIETNSIDRLRHFVSNLTLTLLFEGTDGLRYYTSKEDVLNDSSRRYDGLLINLNLKPLFKKWIKDEAVKVNPIFRQIESDIIFSESKFAEAYRKNEVEIKRSIFKYYIRLLDSISPVKDYTYEAFLKYVYAYNIGDERGCQELISLIKECIYVWNGRLGDKSGSIVKNGVIIGKGTDRYFLYKKIEVQFLLDKQICRLNSDDKFPNFAITLRFKFALKEKSNQPITVDIDYELYRLLIEVKRGYVLTNNDRKKNVNFDSFVRTLLADSGSDLFIYSRYDEGKTYKIAKDEFGSYTIENEG